MGTPRHGIKRIISKAYFDIKQYVTGRLDIIKILGEMRWLAIDQTVDILFPVRHQSIRVSRQRATG